MRVCFVITRGDTWGGAQVHVRDLAQGLTELGHKVRVLVGGEGVLPDALRSLGIPVDVYGTVRGLIHPWKDPRAVLRIRRTLAAFRPHIISGHSVKGRWFATIAGRMVSVPTVWTSHGWRFEHGLSRTTAPIYLAVERFLAKWPARIINVAENERRLAYKFRVGKSDRHVVIPNGMPDVSASKRSAPAKSPVRMVTIARFQAPKDFHCLLHALRGLRELEWELDWIGDGAEEQAARRLARRMDLSERVRFQGRIDDVTDALARGSIFVLSSLREGLPRSIIEAMRAGLPVVATEVGGVPEQVIHGENGFLVPPSEPEELGVALEKLLRSPQLRCRMGRASRERYESTFTFPRMVRRTITVYEEASATVPD